MKTTNTARLSLGLKNKWWANTIVWVLLTAGVVAWQLFIPKQTIDTEAGKVVLSWNSLFRGLFLVSPWVGVTCSVGGQLNVLPKVIANPMFLLSPTVYALMGVGFNKLSKKWGNSVTKDLILLFAFGFIQGILVTLNAALTVSLSGGGWVIFTRKLSELTFDIVALRALAIAIMFMASYPMTVMVRNLCKGSDPFKPNLLERKFK